MSQPTQFIEGSQHDAAARALLAYEHITQIHNRLIQIPEQLGASWMGQSASVYTQVLNEWNPQFKNVVEALHRISENLKDSGIQYQEASTSSHAVTQNLMAALNAS
ncbi:WXG100 family type VII secretion target [Nonomuraea recticatena]|uniref:ESAT-6-like protein n=1 Tax=Nonomuraea recticatena TaxID=46178 RepID=A0ABP6FQ15_9ACTN